MMKMNRTFIAFSAGAILLFTACSKNNDNTSGNNGGSPVTTPAVSTYAGTGVPGYLDGASSIAKFNFPTGICLGAIGDLIIADKQNDVIRAISPQGGVVTIAGTPGTPGLNNVSDSTMFSAPNEVAASASGNILVADEANGVIREITTFGVVSTFAGNVKGATFQTTLIHSPVGVAIDAEGNVYVSDAATNSIVKITPKATITTVAGNGTRGSGNGTAATASFNQPTGLVVDGEGNVYVADAGNNEIRLINTQGQVSTFAGSLTAGKANGKGAAASFNNPMGVAMDSQGNLYVADANNNQIREIATDGTVTTLAGSGGAGANNGALSSSTFNSPEAVAVDSQGNVYVCDTGNSLIRIIQQ
jgi:sugar lactone lactonase YvrE